MRHQALLILPLVSLLPGCLSAFLKNNDDAARSTDYHYEKPDSAWIAADPGGGDAAWRHSADGAVLGVNSVCDQEQDRSLRELTQNSLVGLGVGDAPRTEKNLTVDGQPALRSDIAGELDGKTFVLTLTVIRARTCVYDVSLARAQDAADHAVDYQRLLDSFRAVEAH